MYGFKKPFAYDKSCCSDRIRLSRVLAKKNLSLFEKIKLYINDLLAKLKEAYYNIKPDSEAGKKVLEMKDCVENLHDLLDEAALSARENFRNLSGINKIEADGKVPRANHTSS